MGSRYHSEMMRSSDLTDVFLTYDEYVDYP